MTSVLKLAVVGCGDIAQYMGWFARLNRRIQLIACCDVSEERATRYARRFHIPDAYTSYERLLAETAVDAVYLAVPHHLHAPMLRQAILAGCHVLVEKPLTRTLAEGREIAQLARDSQVRIGVNYQYRYDSSCYALARSVQRGDLGKIYSVRCNVPWYREDRYFEQAPWHGSVATAGGGTLITQGSHLLDAVLWLLDTPARFALGMVAQRKFKSVEVEDLAMGILQMEDGTLVQIASSMTTMPERPPTIEVHGERGTAFYRGGLLPRLSYRGLRVVPKEKAPHRGIHALQRSLEGFRSWVMEGIPYLIPAQEAIPVLAAVEAIYRSAASGKKEEVMP